MKAKKILGIILFSIFTLLTSSLKLESIDYETNSSALINNLFEYNTFSNYGPITEYLNTNFECVIKIESYNQIDTYHELNDSEIQIGEYFCNDYSPLCKKSNEANAESKDPAVNTINYGLNLIAFLLLGLPLSLFLFVGFAFLVKKIIDLITKKKIKK